jgi:hypothetical protein
MTNKKMALGIVITVSLFALVLAGCPTGNNTNAENTLPESKGANALSGKTYFLGRVKTEFSTTAKGAANGTYAVLAVKYNSDYTAPVLENGKYTYAIYETGYYSWNETAKTVTLSLEKISVRDAGSSLLSKAEYRAFFQEYLNQYKKDVGEANFNKELASLGYSSISAYIDDDVAKIFGNVTNNYTFSADGKALFLDETLPANNGSNELSGNTFNGAYWDSEDGELKKNTWITYVFTADSCTYSSGGPTYVYAYAYDSTAKKVYLKLPTTDRETRYSQMSTTGFDPAYFNSADEWKASEINYRYYERRGALKYDTTEKTLLDF